MSEAVDWFAAGKLDCLQDSCENCPFASIGGLEFRLNPQTPNYVPAGQADNWLDGYIHSALDLYGDDWKTCEFSWQPALLIEANEEETK